MHSLSLLTVLFMRLVLPDQDIKKLKIAHCCGEKTFFRVLQKVMTFGSLTKIGHLNSDSPKPTFSKEHILVNR